MSSVAAPEAPPPRGGEPGRRRFGRFVGHLITVGLAVVHVLLGIAAAAAAEVDGTPGRALALVAAMLFSGVVAVASSRVVEGRRTWSPWLALALPAPGYLVLGLLGVVPI
ncbi:hypothetical protein ER308_00045 [Egibacter rhizosphaerae]|uniref:Uncharacterized protein n=1 Tax=Egibacter rhizosphaerae TaxID=1670831 RepID=A0A411YAA5_9ACTN|nr:hypothetical protein [Egibacter rhizosphaerae]QBI18118.1 hypothetical protein ER308_00045 [Egibacter rhizosphaerae]